MTNSNDSIILHDNIMLMKQSNMFERFDHFLVRKWSCTDRNIEPGDITEEELSELRKRAYRNFNKAVKNREAWNSRTVRKWFGIGGYVIPKRETMFKIAFALELSAGETEEYFVKGLLKPSFQINDYQEIIYLYGLDNHLPYEYCEKMVQIFEERMSPDVLYCQDNHTEKLYSMYLEKCNCKPEEFLKFMLDNQEMFKGYSKTVLDYFSRIIEEIKIFITKDAERYLEDIMKANGYDEWKSGKEYSGDIRTDAPKYFNTVAHNKKLYDSMRKAYNEAYGKSRNSHVIREIFIMKKADNDKSTQGKRKIKELTDDGFVFMTDKHLSHILSVAGQKAYYSRLRHGLAALRSLRDDDICPKEIMDICDTGDRLAQDSPAVCMVRPVLEKKLTNQVQCCKLIGREDMLPLIHYLSQRQYVYMIEREDRVYQQKEAREYFINIANNVLTGCGMEPVSEKYKLDYLLLISFEKEDMYSLNDMVDLAGNEMNVE